MSAETRSRLDIQGGDRGMARKRLMSLANSRGYSPDLFEAIARLSVDMSDLTEAGRWYFCCDSKDAAAQDCMARFVRCCGGNMDEVAKQLPLKRAIRDPAAFPSQVRERLQATASGRAILDRRGSDTATQSPLVRVTLQESALAFGCLSVIILVVVFAAVGVSAVVRYITGW